MIYVISSQNDRPVKQRDDRKIFPIVTGSFYRDLFAHKRQKEPVLMEEEGMAG